MTFTGESGMILGIGTDILEIGKLNPHFLTGSDPFLRRTFSAGEIREAAGRRNLLYYYATRFAGKEAVFKAFRISPENIELSEIEILNDPNGAPYVTLYGEMKDRAERMGIKRIHISLSYEDKYAVAFAAAET